VLDVEALRPLSGVVSTERFGSSSRGCDDRCPPGRRLAGCHFVWPGCPVGTTTDGAGVTHVQEDSPTVSPSPGFLRRAN
jgi:hypothetical protein